VLLSTPEKMTLLGSFLFYGSIFVLRLRGFKVEVQKAQHDAA